MLKIDTLGRIISGDDAGMFVKILKSEDTGGFLILISGDPSMKSAFDSWVKDFESLEQYANECNWIIEWF